MLVSGKYRYFLSDRLLHLYKPLIEIQPKDTEFLCLREHESHEFHETMRDEYFLIRGEYHEFYHPDGIRAIRMRSARYPPPQGFVEFVEFVFSKIKR